MTFTLNLSKNTGFVLILFLLLFSCKKHTDFVTPLPDKDPGNSGNTAASFKTTITGIVKDISGTPLSGVTISAYAQTTVTGQYGEFIMKDIMVNERVYVKAEKQGYFTGTATEITSNSGTNDITNVHITLAEKSTTATLSSSSGGTAQDAAGNSVVLPAEGVVTLSGNSYSGNVTVSILHLDPTTPSFGLLTQGADMSAINSSGEQGTLYSYGVLKVELSDASGNELQLAPGKTASLSLKIPASQLASAPSTIPLWYFDEEKGQWIEEGFATKTGDTYVGTVSHFTDWNCDVSSPSASTVTGQVVDCSGKPVPNVLVIIGQTCAHTDQNGTYIRTVPTGVAFEVKVLPFANLTYHSVEPISVPALSASQTYDLPNIILTECVYIINGNLRICNQAVTSGYIIVNGSELTFVENGAFSIVTSDNSAVNISAGNFSTGFVSSKSVAYPPSSNTANAGNLTICTDQETDENSLVINGDGFVNEKAILVPYTNVNSYGHMWHPGGSITSPEQSLTVYSRGILGFVSLAIEDATGPPIGLGEYSFQKHTAIGGLPSTINLTNGLATEVYYAESGTMIITRLDAVGGLIEGTYSGTYRNEDPNTNLPGSKVITVTEGKFSVLRTPNRPE